MTRSRPSCLTALATRPALTPPSRPTRPALTVAGLCLVLLLAACQRELPPTERPPEPQAPAHTELRDAIQQPLDKARAVEQTLQDAAEAQRKQAEAAEGH